MAEVAERCNEEISSLVLDAGEPVSYRQLCTLVDVSLDEGREALEEFAKENTQNVGSIYVTIEKGVTNNNYSPVDPRARVIRLTTNSTSSSQIYGVFLKSEKKETSDEVLDAITINFWAKELKTRNEIMSRTKKAPSSATECFYQSSIKCLEATLRENNQSSAGEVAVTAFDSVKRSASSAFGKSSFFSNNRDSSGKSVSKSSSSASSSSFSSMKSNAPLSAPKVKKSTIDDEAMKNVLTVDSDDDDDMSDGDAPIFVKKIKLAVKSSKNRVISDDDDEPEGEVIAKTPVPREKVKVTAASPNCQKNDEPIAEPSPVKKRVFDPSNVPTKKRVLVTKTELNEKGYMTTKTSYEEVDMTPEEISKAREEMETKFNQQQNKITSSSSSAGKASKGPAKQKSIASFFMKK
jgi:hypothetical protein